MSYRIGLLLFTMTLAACEQEPASVAQEEAVPTPATVTTDESVAPVNESNPLRNAYFGETHMHTSYSLDAYLGGTRLTPSDAYRFAKGEEVEVNGQPYQRKRPLDFTAVTDHAEYLGEMYSTMIEGAPGHDQELLVQLREITDLEERQKWFLKYVHKCLDVAQ